jgi:hypothetical protein
MHPQHNNNIIKKKITLKGCHMAEVASGNKEESSIRNKTLTIVLTQDMLQG